MPATMNITIATLSPPTLNSPANNDRCPQMSEFISQWFYSSLDTYEEKHRLSSETKSSQRRVNFEEFSNSLRQIYESWDADGYDVVNVVPISMGQSESCLDRAAHYHGDVGFSITRGAVVIGKRRGGSS